MRIKATYFIPLLLTLVTSCSIDEKFGFQVEKGVPTTVSLNFDVAGRQVYTRAAQPSEDEYRVGNLYILVFDSEGRRLMVTDDAGADKSFFYGTKGGLSFDTQTATGSVNFNVPSGDVNIVGIANIISEDKTPDVVSGYDISVDDLSMDAIPDLASLKELIVNREDESVFRGKYFLMTGVLENVLVSNAASASGESRNIANSKLMLRRVDAKVTVTMTSELLPTDASFEPKTWKVMRVPKQSLLLPAEGTDPWTDGKNLDATGEAAEYFDMTEPLDFEEINYKDDNDNTFYYNEGSFTFYMPENRKLFSREITETDRTKAYAAREAGLTSETFTFANPNSTYLEMNGYISYTDTDGSVVNADVTFTVHLGYASRNPNDYDTKRNGHYRYTIKVKGISDITAEVEHDEDGYEGDRPGYQGDVIINSSSAQIYNLDAHYETRLLKIPVDHTFDFENMTWSIMTPFCSGVYRNDGDVSDINDYEWIKFAINAQHGGTDPSKFVKFPGIKDTDGTEHYNSSWTPEDIDSRDRHRPLMNIKQLLDYIRYKKTNGELDHLLLNGEICITAFIDEYYYNDHSWKDFVNTYDRQMHIITDGVKYSPDGHSAVAYASYSFVQRSIRSIYNTELNSDFTAWGLETISEPVDKQPGTDGYDTQADTRLNPGYDQIKALGTSLSDDNGLLNTSKLWGELPLEGVIEPTTHTINDDYRKAVYACLLRNRDEDGNGKIEDDELKWYLAAIDQLTGIFIGQMALNKASWLYPFNPGEQTPNGDIRWHYTSSSYDAQSDGPWVLWAEEGASIGSYKKDASTPADPENNENSDKSIGFVNNLYSYRCIRNLGIDTKNPAYLSTVPDDFVVLGENTSGVIIIDMSRLAPNARREKIDDGTLPEHNETERANTTYEGFAVHENAYGVDNGNAQKADFDIVNGDYWNPLQYDATFHYLYRGNWNSFQKTNPCPPGYRPPNQRELLIMASRLSDSQWPEFKGEGTSYYYDFPSVHERTVYFDEHPYYISYTSFSLKDEDPYKKERRDGFLWNSDADQLFLQNNTGEIGYVRCVRDRDI